MKTQDLKSAKRFGARYGRALKLKVANIEKLQHSNQKCPKCMKLKVKRIASGIFVCSGCGSKFADRAYVVSKSK